jgi:hypothetical protein
MKIRERKSAILLSPKKLQGVLEALPGALSANGCDSDEGLISTHSRALIDNIVPDC